MHTRLSSALSLSLLITLLAILHLACLLCSHLSPSFNTLGHPALSLLRLIALNSVCALVYVASESSLTKMPKPLSINAVAFDVLLQYECTAAARSPTVSGTSPSIRCCGTTADCLITVSQSVQGALLAPSDVMRRSRSVTRLRQGSMASCEAAVPSASPKT